MMKINSRRCNWIQLHHAMHNPFFTQSVKGSAVGETFAVILHCSNTLLQCAGVGYVVVRASIPTYWASEYGWRSCVIVFYWSTGLWKNENLCLQVCIFLNVGYVYLVCMHCHTALALFPFLYYFFIYSYWQRLGFPGSRRVCTKPFIPAVTEY